VIRILCLVFSRLQLCLLLLICVWSCFVVALCCFLLKLIIVGSQALTHPHIAPELAASLKALGIPVYVSGMARGVLGAEDRVLMRHKRTATLKSTDFVILAGVPCDFRLNYGRQTNARAFFVMVNLSRTTLRKNMDLRRRNLSRWNAWYAELGERHRQREAAIDEMAAAGSAAAQRARRRKEAGEIGPSGVVELLMLFSTIIV